MIRVFVVFAAAIAVAACGGGGRSQPTYAASDIIQCLRYRDYQVSTARHDLDYIAERGNHAARFDIPGADNGGDIVIQDDEQRAERIESDYSTSQKVLGGKLGLKDTGEIERIGQVVVAWDNKPSPSEHRTVVQGCVENPPHTAASRARAAKAYVLAVCKRHAQPLMSALQTLDSRLDIGLTQSEYTDKVGDIQVVYDRVAPWFKHLPTNEASLDCLKTVAQAENALNEYVRAQRAWERCFDNLDCSNKQVRPTLQRHWSRASADLENASTRLDQLDSAP